MEVGGDVLSIQILCSLKAVVDATDKSNIAVNAPHNFDIAVYAIDNFDIAVYANF